MSRRRAVRWYIVVLALSLTVAGVFAQAEKQEQFEPQVGQAGKDVVWVPTQQDLVEKMLDMAKVTPKDLVIDLGSGDGRTVITAAKRGATALGIEYNPDMVALSKRNAAQAGVSDRATFIKADLFESDFSKGTVLTLFLLPDINIRLRPRILDMKPGTRVVSNSFTMEDWESDEKVTLESGCSTWCTAYLWIVPAKVDGKWKLPDGELTFSQKYQKITGTLVSGGKSVPVAGQLTADQIQFTAGDAVYGGRVNGNSIAGNVKSGASNKTWQASR